MVGAAASADAVQRARRLPALKVGLHIVLVDGRPVLPAARLSHLVDRAGSFRSDMFAMSVRIYFDARVRRQVASEIAAQFEAFAATGLPLDHVDCHKHWHLHPTIAALILDEGRRYGISALRIPSEPANVLKAAGIYRRSASAAVIAACAARLRERLRQDRLLAPDQVFGLAWSGAMTEPRVAALLRHLPEGASEIYTHPATANSFAGAVPGYRYADELSALVSPRIAAVIAANDIRLTTYSDIRGAAISADSRGIGTS